MSQIENSSTRNSAEPPVFSSSRGSKAKASEGLRHTLPGLEADPRFYIKKMDISKTAGGIRSVFSRMNRSINYIKLKSGSLDGNEVYININSLAKRLLLSKKEIKQAIKEGRLEQLIQDRAESFTKGNIEKYKEIFDQYEFVKGELQSQGGLKARTLMKVLEIGFKQMSMEPEKGGIIAADGREFLFKPLKGRVVTLIDLSAGRWELGRGSYGKVDMVYDLVSRQSLAMKTTLHKKGIQDIEKEGMISEMIHGSSSPEKIEIFSIDNPKGRKVYAVMPLQSGSVDKWRGTLQEKQKGMLELCMQARSVHKKGIFHGDIKPENMLFRKNPDGQGYQFALADFGGSVIISKFRNGGFHTPKFTPLYTHKTDSDLLQSIVDESNKKFSKVVEAQEKYEKEKNPSKRAALIKIFIGLRDDWYSLADTNTVRYQKAAEKNDVFSMGVSFFRILMDQNLFPYDSSSEGVEATETLRIDYVPEEIKETPLFKLVTEMLDHDPAKRPTFDQVIERLKKIEEAENITKSK